MNDLELRAYPISLREVGNENEVYLVNYNAFKWILRDFSQLKIDEELNVLEVENFKKDLLKNKPESIIIFVEKSFKIPLIHPYIFMILFEVIKILLMQEKISKEKYSLLCDGLIKERRSDISRYYDLKKMKIFFLSV